MTKETLNIITRGTFDKIGYTSMRAFKLGSVFQVEQIQDKYGFPVFYRYGSPDDSSSFYDIYMEEKEVWLSHGVAPEQVFECFFPELEYTRSRLNHESVCDYLDSIGYVSPPDVENVFGDLGSFVPSENSSEISSEQYEVYRKRSLSRAKGQVFRVVEANNLDMMWTFSFALPDSDSPSVRSSGVHEFLSFEEQSSRECVNKAWAKFRRRLDAYLSCHSESVSSFYHKYHSDDFVFKWVRILEKHDSPDTSDAKRGTYHIHFASNLRIEKDILQSLWGYGNVFFTDYARGMSNRGGIPSGVSPSDYLIKYLGKDFSEDVSSQNPRKSRLWTCSRSCVRPVPIYGDGEISEMMVYPSTCFDFDSLPISVRDSLWKLSSLNDIEVNLFDVGFGSGVYPCLYPSYEGGKWVLCEGYKQIWRFDVRLMSPFYKELYLKKVRFFCGSGVTQMNN